MKPKVECWLKFGQEIGDLETPTLSVTWLWNYKPNSPVCYEVINMSEIRWRENRWWNPIQMMVTNPVIKKPNKSSQWFYEVSQWPRGRALTLCLNSPNKSLSGIQTITKLHLKTTTTTVWDLIFCHISTKTWPVFFTRSLFVPENLLRS